MQRSQTKISQREGKSIKKEANNKKTESNSTKEGSETEKEWVWLRKKTERKNLQWKGSQCLPIMKVFLSLINKNTKKSNVKRTWKGKKPAETKAETMKELFKTLRKKKNETYKHG